MLSARAFLILAMLPGATPGAEEADPRFVALFSVGPSELPAPARLSASLGAGWQASRKITLLAEVQQARHVHEIDTTSLSAALRWRVVGRARTSPFLIAGGGVVRYRSPFYGDQSGTAWSMGAGLEHRASRRLQVFLEGRLNVWIGVADGLDGELPVRVGLRLAL